MSKVGYAITLTVLLTASCASSSHEPENQPPVEHGAQGAGNEAAQQPGGGDASAQDQLAQDRQAQSLDEQKRALLLEQHIENGRAMMKALRFDEAETEFVRALDLDPNNLEAKKLLQEVSALLGKQPGEVATIAQDMAQHYQVKVQQMQAQAISSVTEGDKAMARGDYERAIAEYSIAQNYIRWAPYSIDWQGLDKRADEGVKAATAKREEAETKARKEAEERAAAELREQGKAQRARRAAVVDNMITQSIEAFDAANYDESIDFADQALHEDPRNERATEIRDAAFRAGRQQVRDDYVLNKREQFKRWQEELDKLRVPETGIYTLPDIDYWTDITAKRASRRGIDLTLTESPAERDLKAQLKTMHIPGLQVKDEESLSKVIDILRTFTGLPLVVDPAADAAATGAGVVFNFSFTSPLSVEDALNIITKSAGPDVTWTVRHDAILVTTKAKARGNPVIYNHDVNDLVFGLTDFLGPRIDRLRLLEEMTDDDGGGPFGGIGEKPKLYEISALATLIKDNVAVGTWEQEGVSIAEGEGYLLVVHTAEVQKQVRDFLNELRRFGSSLVTIESKFMTVSSNWLQEIGVDFRGIDNPVTPFKDLDDVTNGLEDNTSRGLDNGGLGAASGIPSSGFFYDDGQDGDFKGRTEHLFSNPLGNALSSIGGLTAQLTFFNDLQVSAILRAVEKTTDYQLINNQILSVHNTQRAYVSVVNQRAYIQDFDVEVAQFQAVADPQINVLNEGVVLDVRPTIHHDRKYLTLEIQPTVAKVVALRNFSSTLGGNTSPVEFQLPELEVQSVFTTAVIPDGGSILLGGLSNVRNIERRAEVPWLAKLPIVGFLLKNEGYSEESKSLMILIRAHIADPNEEVKKLEGKAR